MNVFSSVDELFKQRAIWNAHTPALDRTPCTSASLTFDITEIDTALPGGGLESSVLHEFALRSGLPSERQKKQWFSPFYFLQPLLSRLLTKEKPSLLWIGRRCWPTAYLSFLVHKSAPALSSSLLSQSSTMSQGIFLDPPDKAKRLWSILEALRFSHFPAIVADGSYLSFIATRRIQLAAAKSSSLLFLIRPPWELSMPSVAHTRWEIAPQQSAEESLRWNVTLHKARGLLQPQQWNIELCEYEYGTKNSLRLFSDSERGSSETRSLESPSQESGGDLFTSNTLYRIATR